MESFPFYELDLNYMQSNINDVGNAFKNDSKENHSVILFIGFYPDIPNGKPISKCFPILI